MTDVQRLARQLQPLIPTQVRRWMRMRESVDGATRALIDEQIRAAARRLLGEVEGQTLLSLPPAKLIREGSIHLGAILYAGERGEARLRLEDVMQNVAIFGRSGAGKTNAVFHLLLQLSKQGVPFLFLDWKRTARHLIPTWPGPKPALYTPGRSVRPLRFNPLTPPPALEPDTYIAHLVDVMAEAYDLGDGAISVLQRALSESYRSGELSPSVDDVLRRIEAYKATGRASGWTVSATRALRSIGFANLTDQSRSSQERLVEEIMHRSTIVELDGLSASARRFLVPILCLWIYHQRLATRQRERLELVIVIEEAHHLLLRERGRGSESVMSVLLRQCRELGIGMIIVDQHPHLISSAALGNASVTMFLNLKDPADVAKAAGLCALGDDQDKHCFTMLPIGHAIVKLQDRWRRAFLVRMPQVQVDKGSVSDDDIRSWTGNESTGSNRFRTDNRVDSGNFESGSGDSPAALAGSSQIGQVLKADEVLGGDDLALLDDVLAHPDDGIRVRYARLRLSGERGNEAKKRLLAGGWIEGQAVAIGRTRKMLLRPTRRTRAMRGLETAPEGEGSIAHEYWRRFYARQLRNAGHVVHEESRRNGGRVDLLARRNGSTVGVEIETGKSDVIGNVRACLRAGFSCVLVIATDSRAMRKVERQLAGARLLIPGRVDLLLAPAVPPLGPSVSSSDQHAAA